LQLSLLVGLRSSARERVSIRMPLLMTLIRGGHLIPAAATGGIWAISCTQSDWHPSYRLQVS